MTSQGSPYSRFRRALATGNPLLVRAAAHELERVGLDDALAVCLVFARSEPNAYERAALRWLSRLLAETGTLSLADAEATARLLGAIGRESCREAAGAELAQLLAARDLSPVVRDLQR